MIQRLFYGFFRAQMPVWLVLPLFVFTLSLGMGGGFVSANVLTPSTECPEEPEVCAEFGLFWQVWDLASSHFVDADAVVPQQMIEGAISGMLASLGDEGHTHFLSAEDAERWEESLNASFEGIGAYISARDDQLIIVAPIEGSPAEAAGIRAGDVILEVDGEDTTGWTVEELVSRVRGPKDTSVVLTVLHPGERAPVDIEVERAQVEIPSVSWSMLPDDIAFVRLSSFSQRAHAEMEKALREAQAEGAQALILDLRNNPGGLVDEARMIGGQFMPSGTTLMLEENRNGNRTPTRIPNDGRAQDIPMVVLVNFNSASSSEILAGALQDEERATVIGTRTVGTGTVLTPFRLAGGARVLLGTSQWLTPDGRLIRNQGIEPDIEIILPGDVAPLSPSEASELSDNELQESEDVQLLEALEYFEDLDEN